MTKIIWIDGGIGRVITSIPALLKYHQNNLNEEWYIMIPSWDYVTWGFPELQERTFDPDMKGSFDLCWKADQVMTPEPYRVPAYYRNEISLKEAFDVALNNSTDHSDLPPMQLRLSVAEKRAGLDIIEKVKKEQKKKKTIVLQPYGGAANPHPSGPYDDTLRSIPKPMLDYFVDNLSKDYNLIFMGAKDFHKYYSKTFKPAPDPSLRNWMGIINAADYFIGCDSCGQHICKSLNKKASLVFSGTHRNNITYDDFHIIERDIPFYSSAMRLSNLQSNLSSRLNEPRIEFTSDEIEDAYQDIIKNIGKELSYS